MAMTRRAGFMIFGRLTDRLRSVPAIQGQASAIPLPPARAVPPPLTPGQRWVVRLSLQDVPILWQVQLCPRSGMCKMYAAWVSRPAKKNRES